MVNYILIKVRKFEMVCVEFFIIFDYKKLK